MPFAFGYSGMGLKCDVFGYTQKNRLAKSFLPRRTTLFLSLSAAAATATVVVVVILSCSGDT